MPFLCSILVVAGFLSCKPSLATKLFHLGKLVLCCSLLKNTNNCTLDANILEKHVGCLWLGFVAAGADGAGGPQTPHLPLATM